MAYVIARFLQPLRFRVSLSSNCCPPTVPFCGKIQPLKTWKNGLQSPPLHIRPASSNWRYYFQKFLHTPNFRNSGCEFSIGSIFRVSIVLGSVSFWPQIAYSFDGVDMLLDDHPRIGSSCASGLDQDPHTFLAFTRKLMMAFFLVATVLINWGHPVTLAAKLILILLSSKPSPSSVYIFIDQWRHQSIRQLPLCQLPLFYKFKRVEVEDYTFLCTARVELNGQKFTLIGVLGSWWVLQLSPRQGMFSVLRNKVINIFN